MNVRNEPSILNKENAKIEAIHLDFRFNQGKLKEAKINIDLALTKLKNDSLLCVRQENLNEQGGRYPF